MLLPGRERGKGEEGTVRRERGREREGRTRTEREEEGEREEGG